VAEHIPTDKVIVMDADGEDAPAISTNWQPDHWKSLIKLFLQKETSVRKACYSAHFM
jgi:hypothetical protein